MRYLICLGHAPAKKAIGAVAASMLIAAYHMLKDVTFYQDLGANHFDRRAKEAATKRLIAGSQASAMASPSPRSPRDRRGVSF